MRHPHRRGWFAAVLFVALASRLPAPAEEVAPPVEEAKPEEEEKGRGAETEGWAPYVEFVEKTYVPAEEADGSQEVRLKFHVDPEVPKGAKIFISFLYLGTTLETLEYIQKDENRKNLTLVWKPKDKLAEGEYFVMTKLPLFDQGSPEKKIPIQTGAVQRLIKERKKRFPPANEPWQRLYMKDESEAIVVRDAKASGEENAAICKTYRDFMEELVSNMNEFVEQMDKVKAGEEYSSAGALDEDKLAKFVEDWRKKQGRTQTSILQFQLKEPGLFQRSMTAHANLLELGRMVSKRSYQALKEVSDQFKLKKVINPAAEGFDRSYRYAVTAESLEKRLETIEGLVCPPEAKEAEEGAAEGAEGEGTPPGEAAPSAEAPGETPEVVPETPAPEEAVPEEAPKETKKPASKKPAAKKAAPKSTSKAKTPAKTESE